MDEVTFSYIVFLLACLPCVLYPLSICFFLISLVYERVKLHRKVDPTVFLTELPGVSIVKPLMGVDPLLEVNLESHFLMNYPKFELLIGIQDDQDPAINLVNKLRERYPKVDCKLFIGGKDGVLNPMVHNMALPYENASYDLVWISSSRVKASTDIILDMVAKIQNPRVALVHQIPFVTDQKGFVAAVEKVYFGASAARYYLAFNALGINCMTGMSYLVDKVELDKVNGLTWFGRYLAEDFFLSKMLHEKGFRHQVAAIPAQQNVGSSSIAGYKDRMVRWTRLRLNMMTFTTVCLEPLGEAVPLGIYMAWSMYHFFGINPYIFFFIHWAAWCTLDYFQLKGVQNGPLPFGKLTYLLAWLTREFLWVMGYFEAILNPRRVTWGKRTYRLSRYGESLEIVSDKAVLPI